MNKRNNIPLAAATILLGLVPGIASALGLGEIAIHSALNQPLAADIKILGLDGLERNRVKFRMADVDSFHKAGIDRPSLLNRIRFSWKTSASGQSLISLTTNRSVKDPYLNFLVEVVWPQGRMVREYTLLLDPPLYDGAVIAKAEEIVATSKPAIEKKLQKISNEDRQVVKKAVPVAANPLVAKQQISAKYRTKNGDNLWLIARQASRQQGVSLNDMMAAIIKQNKHAFANQDGSLMYREVMLTIPTLSDQDAGELSRPAPNTAKPNQKKQAHLQLVMPKNIVKEIAKADALKQSADAVSVLKQQLAIAKEAIETSKRENEVLKEELLLVSKQAASLRTLVELKKSEINELRQDAEQDNGALLEIKTDQPISLNTVSVDKERSSILAMALSGLGLLLVLAIVGRKWRKRNLQKNDSE